MMGSNKNLLLEISKKKKKKREKENNLWIIYSLLL